MGPAPTTSTVCGSQNVRRPMVRICSHALATTVVGSNSTPRTPRLAVDPDDVLGLDPPPLGHEAVRLLDAALGVAAVGAHVPLADRTVRARHRVRPSHDAHDMVSHRQPGGPRVEHPAEGLVAEDQPLLTRWRPPVVSARDLRIRAADADGQGFDDHRTQLGAGLGDIVEPRRTCGTGHHRHGLHDHLVSISSALPDTGTSTWVTVSSSITRSSIGQSVHRNRCCQRPRRRCRGCRVGGPPRRFPRWAIAWPNHR